MTARRSRGDAAAVDELLRTAIRAVDGARTMPMSGSVMVNRDELLALLAEAVERLPDEITRARWVLRERSQIVAQAQAEAEEIIAEAKSRVAAMAARQAIVKAAEHEARTITESAAKESRRLRRETEDYCDHKLASFEIVLERIAAAVAAGRERLGGPVELALSDERIDEVASTRVFDQDDA